jgi:hypothetical protein
MNHIYNQSQFGEVWFNYPELYKKMVKRFSSGSKFVEIGIEKGMILINIWRKYFPNADIYGFE